MTAGRKCTYCKSDKLHVSVTGNGATTGHEKYQIVCSNCGASGPAHNIPIYHRTAEQSATLKILIEAGNLTCEAAEEWEKSDKHKSKYIAANNVYLDLVANLSGYIFGE